MSRPDRTIILDARAMSRALQRMTVEVLELAHGTDDLADFGRPKRISHCVLVDRGGRELPIHPDIVGKQVKVNSGERVDVLVEELDGRDEVALVRQGAPA